MLILGLTGSISTGKSTVSSILSQSPYSLPIIDADVLAREVVLPGTKAYQRIVEYFGATTPDLLLPPSASSSDAASSGNGDEFHRDGRRGASNETHASNETDHLRPLNRAALGRRVFGDDPARRKDRAVLNSIIHPAVRRAIYVSVLKFYIRGSWAVVLDVPLLFESGLDVFCGTVLVVGVHDPEVQIRRLLARDRGLTRQDAEHRVASQGDVRVKAKRADMRDRMYPGSAVVVWNDAGREKLMEEMERVMHDVRKTSPAWWARALWIFPPLAVVVGLWDVWRSWRAAKQWETETRRRAE